MWIQMGNHHTVAFKIFCRIVLNADDDGDNDEFDGGGDVISKCDLDASTQSELKPHLEPI